MAVRQYVGARYVPKFAEPYDWQENTSYEALTVVQYNNSSYTSKVPVPATVGNPAQNPQYWALTGNYNAQVEDYRQTALQASEGLAEEISNREQADTEQKEALQSEIDNRKEALQSEIDNRKEALQSEIDNRKEADNLITSFTSPTSKEFILITDSYGTVPESNNYIDQLKALYPNSHFTAVGGTGFGSDVYIAQNFLSTLNGITVTNPNKIKAIYVIGGANDANLINSAQLDATVLRNRIDSFANTCLTTYPNATVYVCMVGWNRKNALIGYVSARDIYRSECLKHKNLSYINGLDTLFHNTKLLNATDNIHPTETGTNYLAEYMADIINSNSNVTNISYIVEPTITPTPGLTLASYYVYATYSSNYVTIRFVGQRSNFLDLYGQLEEEKTITYTDYLDLGTFDNFPRPHANSNVVYASTSCTLSTSNGVVITPCTMEINMEDGHLYFRPRSQSSDTVKTFWIAAFEFTIPLW